MVRVVIDYTLICERTLPLTRFQTFCPHPCLKPSLVFVCCWTLEYTWVLLSCKCPFPMCNLYVSIYRHPLILLPILSIIMACLKVNTYWIKFHWYINVFSVVLLVEVLVWGLCRPRNYMAIFVPQSANVAQYFPQCFLLSQLFLLLQLLDYLILMCWKDGSTYIKADPGLKFLQ